MLADPPEKCLAVIPARGGSKRIPRKNVVPFAGKPLIAWTIEAARASGLFARVVVSTEDEEIAAVSRQYGADVPFQRTASLADDHTAVSAVTVGVVERLRHAGEEFDLVCQLLPSCPLRTAEDVRNSRERMRATQAEVQLSVSRYEWLNPWWAMRMDESGSLEPLFPDVMKALQRSQDLPPVFCIVGAIWWATVPALLRERTFHVAHRTGWEVPFPRGIDIDTEDDLRTAAALRASSAAARPSG